MEYSKTCTHFCSCNIMKRSFDEDSLYESAPLSLSDLNRDAMSSILTHLLPSYIYVIRSVSKTWLELGDYIQKTEKDQQVIMTDKYIETLIIGGQLNVAFEKTKNVIKKCAQNSQVIFDCFEKYMYHMYEVEYGTPNSSSFDPNVHVDLARQNMDLIFWMINTTSCGQMIRFPDKKKFPEIEAALNMLTYFPHMIIQNNLTYVKNYDFWQPLGKFNPIFETYQIKSKSNTTLTQQEIEKYVIPEPEKRTVSFWMLVCSAATITDGCLVSNRRQKDVFREETTAAEDFTPQMLKLNIPKYNYDTRPRDSNKTFDTIEDVLDLVEMGANFFADGKSIVMFWGGNRSNNVLRLSRNLKCTIEDGKFEQFKITCSENGKKECSDPYPHETILEVFKYKQSKFLKEYLDQMPPIKMEDKLRVIKSYDFYRNLNEDSLDMIIMFINQCFCEEEYHIVENLIVKFTNQIMDKLGRNDSYDFTEKNMKMFTTLFEFVTRYHTEMDKAGLSKKMLNMLNCKTLDSLTVCVIQPIVIYLLKVLEKNGSKFFIKKTFRKCHCFTSILAYESFELCFKMMPEILQMESLLSKMPIPMNKSTTALIWNIPRIDAILKCGYVPTGKDILSFIKKREFEIAYFLLEVTQDKSRHKEIKTELDLNPNCFDLYETEQQVIQKMLDMIV